MKFNTAKFRSPVFIFSLYVILASLVILGFRYFFPGEIAPLPIFSKSWRLIRGVIEIIILFPAVAFSALVIPFGIPSDFEDSHTKFSPHFFQRMMSPVITAIGAAGLYALMSFLALPMLRNYEGNMRLQGEMYRQAREEALAHGRAGEWLEASQFIGICDSVWKDSPELASLRAEVEIHFEESLYSTDPDQTWKKGGAAVSALPGQREPVDATEAIAMGEAAMSEERFMDAHWLATLGQRIAREGSPEAAAASRLAARAWNQIEIQRPAAGETRAWSLYQLKLTAYQAMVSDDWIRAFYLFQELAGLSPNDPDVEHFLAASERGTREIAFFLDEMEVSSGKPLVEAVFSLPAPGGGQGRTVMRVSGLSSSPDFAYGTGIEYMVFDTNAKLLFSLYAPYAKFLPITLDGRRQVLVRMRALDRRDSTRRWEPVWSGQGEDSAQITLNVTYETFLMLTQMRQGLDSLQIGELSAARDAAPETGYVAQVFEAEILNRLGSCLFFLPMAIVAIIIGWVFRARRYPRYMFVPLLPVLPLVFNGLACLYRTVLNIAGASLILALGYSAALTLFIVILALSFLLSLILLAAQHG